MHAFFLILAFLLGYWKYFSICVSGSQLHNIEFCHGFPMPPKQPYPPLSIPPISPPPPSAASD